MRAKDASFSPMLQAGLMAGLCAGLVACGGGGGGGSNKVRFGNDITDPVIDLEGGPGRFSRTPEEANADNGANPPPRLHTQTSNQNHYFRLEFPFRVTTDNFLLNDPLLAPFSFLNGTVTVTDLNGNHLPGVALVNGVDVNGVDRTGDDGFPFSIDSTGQNRNLPFTDDDGVFKDVFLFIADTDGDLSTLAAFNPAGSPENGTSSLETVKITLAEVNGFVVNGAWTINIGTGPSPDRTRPTVLSVIAEVPDPDAPDVANQVSPDTSFVVQFNEPMVPQSVGRSAALNGFPFEGNKPRPPLVAPFPNTVITATVPTLSGTQFIPFDCNPVSRNNLTAYRLRPLAPLPASPADPSDPDGILRTPALQVVEQAVNANGGVAAQDLSGNVYDGEDTDGDGIADSAAFTQDFAVGEGRPVINIPVSPEVVYLLPSGRRGIGAIDLNGWGFNTNTPGLHEDNPAKMAIVTMAFQQRADSCGVNLNLASGIARLGTPYNPGTGQCAHNQFHWPFTPFGQFDNRQPVGLGGFKYGFGITTDYLDDSDPGNPGTPVPGVNEMSEGLDTICRNSNGETILTGSTVNGTLGVIEDIQVGEFLDLIYFDTQNPFLDPSLHISTFGGVATNGRNVISDPPSPNPPPLRYWVGLPQIEIVVDTSASDLDAFLIEGDEVFLGTRGGRTGIQQLQPNVDNPFAADQTIFPHNPIGPGIQSSTQPFVYSARQQIGNFLYVTDVESRSVHALNSNTMRIIDSIELPDPRGLGIAPSNEFLYVSNSEDNSVSVINTNPLSPDFHTEIARVPVGIGPRSVTVQPDNEDVHVCNFTGNTISILDQQTLTIRKEITALINQPFDIALTGRQGIPGSQAPYGFQAGIYFGYISNFGGNSLLVYESGPDGPQGIGHDNILGELPTGDEQEPYLAPRGLCYAPFANPQGFDAGGVFLAHQDDEGFGRVSLVQFTNQGQFGPLPIVAAPGFFIPPGFLDRNFEQVASWGNTDDNRLAGFVPTDVDVADLDVNTYQGNPSGAPNFSTGLPPPNVDETGFINSHHFMRVAGGVAFHVWQPDRMYVSFADTDTIQVLDPQEAGIVIKTFSSELGSGIKSLATYWDQ